MMNIELGETRCARYVWPKGSQHASSSCAQEFARISNYPSCNPWVTATITQHYDLKKGRPRWRYRGIQSRPPNFEMVLLQMHGESTAAKCNANTTRTEAIAILCLCHESTWQKAWWIHRCKSHANAQNIKPRGLSKRDHGVASTCHCIVSPLLQKVHKPKGTQTELNTADQGVANLLPDTA